MTTAVTTSSSIRQEEEEQCQCAEFQQLQQLDTSTPLLIDLTNTCSFKSSVATAQQLTAWSF
jgi:hypothetical protein